METPSSIKILFVGNSYTYFNNLVHVFLSQKKNDDGPEIRFRALSLVEGGQGLFDLSESFVAILSAFSPDVIVLQDQSTTPAGWHPSDVSPHNRFIETQKVLRDVFVPALQLWATKKALVPKKVVLFAPWGRSEAMFESQATRSYYQVEQGCITLGIDSEFKNVEALEAGYRKYAQILIAGSESGEGHYTVSVAPVGRTLYETRQAILGGDAPFLSDSTDEGRAEVAESFYIPNDRFAHPASEATVLAALVLWRWITGERATRGSAFSESGSAALLAYVRERVNVLALG